VAFLLIAAATTISTFVTFGITPSLLEVFRQTGASPALALQLGSARGVIAMSARFMDMLLGRRANPILSGTMGVGLMVVSFLMLALASPSTPVLVTFTLLYSFGGGVMAVARALLPLALFSPGEYGLYAARLSLPQNLANAVGPVVFTAILDHAGATTALFVCAALATLALGLLAMLTTLVRRATAKTADVAGA
jgi:predicted MFS family arabinose efflux permease